MGNVALKSQSTGAIINVDHSHIMAHTFENGVSGILLDNNQIVYCQDTSESIIAMINQAKIDDARRIEKVKIFVMDQCQEGFKMGRTQFNRKKCPRA